MKEYLNKYAQWRASEAVDELTRRELEGIENDDAELRLRFGSALSFGTAGLRGVMRAGTAAMNVYTVAHATQALGELICRRGAAGRGVAIAWDSRHNSRLFAETAAGVLAASGIKVFIFDDLRPTPELSFAVRRLGCIAGINITASHNPKQYNGYKAYWEDGAQLSPEDAAEVASAMDKLDIFADVSRMPFDEALASGYVSVIGDSLDAEYEEAVLAERVDAGLIPAAADKLRVIYTPLHGTGCTIIPRVLRAAGVKHLATVDEQMTPDGSFPTTPKPNPEYPQVFELGREYAERLGADLIIATDPDADRVGVTLRLRNGDFTTLTGNQIGSLLLDYITSAYIQGGNMPPEPYAVKSIVTTELAARICADRGVRMYNVLTGFKFIGEVMERHEREGHGSFILGFEESYGFLKGMYARDKDAVVASLLICEMAAFHAMRGRTLGDALQALYEKYGYYREGIDEIYMEGVDGAARMATVMESLRKAAPAEIGGEKIRVLRDYRAQLVRDTQTGETEPTGLPASDVLGFESEQGNITIVRPSGTEPKIKFYYLVHADTPEAAAAAADACAADMKALTRKV